jgi:HSF-type DNA-binding
LDATPYSVKSVSSIALPPTITVTNASYQLSRDSSSDEGDCDPISLQFTIDSFIGKLMRLLLEERFSMILSFLPDNQSFGIINAKAFTEDVMPNTFGIKSFASFCRKLTRWGFERIMDKRCHDIDVFWHPHFRKGDWITCSKIKCEPRLLPQTSQGTCSEREVIPLPSGSYQQQRREDGAFVSTPVMSSYPIKETWKPTLQDVTSLIVGAALETLRMEEAVIAPVISVETIMQRHQERAVMLAMHHQDMMAQLSSTLKSES